MAQQTAETNCHRRRQSAGQLDVHSRAPADRTEPREADGLVGHAFPEGTPPTRQTGRAAAACGGRASAVA